jgi:hypothetical protein
MNELSIVIFMIIAGALWADYGLFGRITEKASAKATHEAGPYLVTSHSMTRRPTNGFYG